MSRAKVKAASVRRVGVLKAQLERFKQIAEEARESASWTATVAALGKAREVEAEIDRVLATVDLGTIASPESRLRRAAEMAMMDGSFTAAASLEREAEEMRRARVAAAAAAKEAAAAGADPLALIATLVGVVRSWPAPLRERLVAELAMSAVH